MAFRSVMAISLATEEERDSRNHGRNGRDKHSARKAYAQAQEFGASSVQADATPPDSSSSKLQIPLAPKSSNATIKLARPIHASRKPEDTSNTADYSLIDPALR